MYDPNEEGNIANPINETPENDFNENGYTDSSGPLNETLDKHFIKILVVIVLLIILLSGSLTVYFFGGLSGKIAVEEINNQPQGTEVEFTDLDMDTTSASPPDKTTAPPQGSQTQDTVEPDSVGEASSGLDAKVLTDILAKKPTELTASDVELAKDLMEGGSMNEALMAFIIGISNKLQDDPTTVTPEEANLSMMYMMSEQDWFGSLYESYERTELVRSCDIDEVANSVTIGGLDENKNMVRDDVECILADKFELGSDRYQIAFRHAQAFQAMLTGKILYSKEQLADEEYWSGTRVGEPLTQQFWDTLTCFGLKDISQTYPGILEEINWITYAMLNTKERSSAYGSLMTGLSLPVCPLKHEWVWSQ